MMQEKTIALTISSLLPEVQNERHSCLSRLEDDLRTRKGIERVHLDQDGEVLSLCLHYDPGLLSGADVRRIAHQSATRIVNRYHHHNLQLTDLDCSDCALVVEHGLTRMPGVLSVQVSYPNQVVQVEYDSRQTNQRAIERRVRQLGYRLATSGLYGWFLENRELIFSLAAGVFLATGWAGSRFFNLVGPLLGVFYGAAYFLGGLDVSRHALFALREKRFDTDFLMDMAALGAAVLGDFAEGALLLFLFSLGHALEERAMQRARRAVSSLADLAPKWALVRRDGREVSIPVEQVALGERVIIRPGVRIPVDGEVVDGDSSVDQSPVTGEGLPVSKGPGDLVFAGTINGRGALELKTTRLAKDSTLARVMKLVEQAQAQKSPSQQLSERFARIFVPSLLAADALLIVLPPLFGVPFSDSFLRAMTLLVAASPCALALGTPAAVLAGIARAARHGVLIKGGAYLEALGRMRAIAFDKTGTLTVGKPRVSEVLPLNGYSRQEVLAIAAGLESRSAHPLAEAIGEAARQPGAEIPAADEVQSLTGLGVRGRIGDRPVLVGSMRLFADERYRIQKSVEHLAATLEKQGNTVVLVGVQDEIIGLVAIGDHLRDSATTSLKAVRSLGVEHTILLSGDNQRAAHYIAAKLGIDQSMAELMPEEKLQAVRELCERFGVVGMVGDGVNDAPALAHASVGIAMGGAATDVALESADVALMASDLDQLPFAIGLGRATRKVILQNLTFSLVVIAVLSSLVLAGLAGIGAAIVIHEGSTLLVLGNALRLLNYRLE